MCPGISGEAVWHLRHEDRQCVSQVGLFRGGGVVPAQQSGRAKYLARLEKKHDKGKALTILAHQLARAVYYMLKRHPAFDLDPFLHSSGSRVGEPDASLDTQGMSLDRAYVDPQVRP